MSNTFWAVFFGSAVGLFSVNVITTAIDEWRHRQRHRNMRILLEDLEDYEFDDED